MTTLTMPPVDLQSAHAGRLDALRLHQRSHISADKIDEVAADFEAVFITQMLQHMFEGVEGEELFGGGQAGDVYRTLLLDEYGKLIAQSGGLGVAEQVRAELMRMQEVTQAAAAEAEAGAEAVPASAATEHTVAQAAPGMTNSHHQQAGEAP